MLRSEDGKTIFHEDGTLEMNMVKDTGFVFNLGNEEVPYVFKVNNEGFTIVCNICGEKNVIETCASGATGVECKCGNRWEGEHN